MYRQFGGGTNSNDIATYTLGASNESLSSSFSALSGGSWSVTSNELFTANGQDLVVNKSGTYAVTYIFHGLVNTNTYINSSVYNNTTGSYFARATSLAPYNQAIQGVASGCAIVNISAGQSLRWVFQTSDTNDYLFGSQLSSQNKVVVQRLGY